MEYKLRKYSMGYKYFFNENIVFVTSAKLGSRFFKKVSENLEYINYDNPINLKLEEMEFNYLYFPERVDFTKYSYENLFKNKKVVFLIRDPLKRFVSGLTTNFELTRNRCFDKKEDGVDFLKHYFPTDLTGDELKIQIQIFLKTFEKFLITQDVKHLKNLIENYVVTHSIYKDNHVEFHHYFSYNFMVDLEDMGVELNYININDVDSYFKSKELIDWGYNEKMGLVKNSMKANQFYSVLTDNIEIWKNEIKELSLYFDTEYNYYNKIQEKYEILL